MRHMVIASPYLISLFICCICCHCSGFFLYVLIVFMLVLCPFCSYTGESFLLLFLFLFNCFVLVSFFLLRIKMFLFSLFSILHQLMCLCFRLSVRYTNTSGLVFLDLSLQNFFLFALFRKTMRKFARDSKSKREFSKQPKYTSAKSTGDEFVLIYIYLSVISINMISVGYLFICYSYFPF